MSNLRNKKIVLTGGHAASTAFEVFKEARKRKKNWDFYWIGFKSSIEGENIPTLPILYFPKYGIKTYGLISGRLQRTFTLWTIPSLLKIPVGLLQAFFLLLKIKPHIIVSFGGSSSIPVVIAGFFLRIPILIHEQVSVAGIANRFGAIFAKKVAISRISSKKYFPRGKTVLTGNPIDYTIFKPKILKNIPKEPLILVTGGQSGSLFLNEVVEKSLERLLSIGKVIHLTGLKEEEKFKKIKESLDKKLKRRYWVFGTVSPDKYAKIFNSASIVISRAGANTVSKIVASFKPSILVPIPFSYLQEQEKNASFAKRYAGSRIIHQDELTPKSLISEVIFLKNNWKKIAKGLKKNRNPDIKAREKLVLEIENLIK